MFFADRAAAGRQLVYALQPLLAGAPPPPALVLGIPRGGVIVGRVVADALAADLDVVVIRKIPDYWNEETGVGAVGPGGVQVLEPDADTDPDLPRRAALAEQERQRREVLYRGERPFPALAGRDVIVVDDGAATGYTARVALRALRGRGVRRLLLALPVAPADTAAALRRECDAAVILAAPGDFQAVSRYYGSFAQVSDHEVRAALRGTR